jgi:hypothetical protein
MAKPTTMLVHAITSLAFNLQKIYCELLASQISAYISTRVVSKAISLLMLVFDTKT